jgi:hypothetical protein
VSTRLVPEVDQPLQVAAPLRLGVHRRVEPLPGHREHHWDDVRLPARAHRGQPGDRTRGEAFPQQRLVHPSCPIGSRAGAHQDGADLGVRLRRRRARRDDPSEEAHDGLSGVRGGPVLLLLAVLASDLWAFRGATSRAERGRPVVAVVGPLELATPAAWPLACLLRVLFLPL